VSDLKLRVAFWDYDRTRPLVDGRVRVSGVVLEPVLLRPREAFTRMLESEEFDVAEVSLASFVRLKADRDERFVGIPVALSKMFRHSCIYVRSDAGIETPADLRGRRIGVSQIDSTGIVFIKGLLRHDYGLLHDEMEWFIGGLEKPATQSSEVPASHGSVKHATDHQTLVGELEAGELDAIFSNHMPTSFTNGGGRIRRLFADCKTVEKDYFRRTGILPVMHIVAIRSELCRLHPWLANSLYNAFCEARDLAISGLYDTDALRLTLPWLIDHIEETRAILGREFWSYGLEPNREAFGAICQYQFEQSLTSRLVSVDELFIAGGAANGRH
jgi:4,5-dihydroxyphthalate decarboxylase